MVASWLRMVCYLTFRIHFSATFFLPTGDSTEPCIIVWLVCYLIMGLHFYPIFCTYWRFNEPPYLRFNEPLWLVVWSWLIMMIGALPNYAITLSFNFVPIGDSTNLLDWLYYCDWLRVIVPIGNYWIGLRIWCLISGLKWTRLVHFRILSGSSLKAFAPKLQSENLALNLEMR